MTFLERIRDSGKINQEIQIYLKIRIIDVATMSLSRCQLETSRIIYGGIFNKVTSQSFILHNLTLLCHLPIRMQFPTALNAIYANTIFFCILFCLAHNYRIKKDRFGAIFNYKASLCNKTIAYKSRIAKAALQLNTSFYSTCNTYITQV